MKVRPFSPAETPAAVSIASRAFADDPLFQFVYPDPAQRIRGFTREHAAYVRHYYRPYGVCEVAEENGKMAGMALWLPPNTAPPFWRELLTLPTLARSVGLQRLRTVQRAYRVFDDALPPQPVWYLGLLAVAPEWQGRGVGSALVRAGLARADRDGVPTFLETGTTANIAFYERRGFSVTGEILLPDGPTHWAMLRPPGGPRRTGVSGGSEVHRSA